MRIDDWAIDSDEIEDAPFDAALASGRFLPLPDRDLLDAESVLRDFALQQEPDSVREMLLEATEKRRPFSRFEDVAADHGRLHAWFSYRAARYAERAQEFLEARDIPFVNDLPQTPRLRLVRPGWSPRVAVTDALSETAVVGAMRALAERRPLFHGATDFRHAVAWTFANTGALAEVRIERPLVLDDRRAIVDVSGRVGETSCALQLHYWTRRAHAVISGETFALRESGPRALARHDFWRDARLLERTVDASGVRVGVVLALTNDPPFWLAPDGGARPDRAFGLHEGRRVECNDGPLAWGRGAPTSVLRGREQPVQLRDDYSIVWHSFGTRHDAGPLRYTFVRITPTG
jgi:hypothetical protein